MQIAQILADVRVLLDEPNQQHPTERHLFTVLTHHLQTFLNELSNSGQNWNVGNWDLNVMKDQDTYPVDAPEWGKPIFVLTRHTDPSIPDWQVPIVDIEHFRFPQGGSGGWQWGSPLGYSASAIGFYFTQLPVGETNSVVQPYAKVGPMPRDTATYTIWYQKGPMTGYDLTTETMLPEHHQLLVTRTALSTLPYCRWGAELTPDLIIAKINMIKASLQFANELHEDAFQRYITNLRQEPMSTRILFGEYDW